jgi:hypothetical protein
VRSRPREQSEFFSFKHRDWDVSEWEFVAKKAHRGFPDKHPHAIGPVWKGDTTGEEQLSRYVERLQDPERQDNAIFELLEKVGPVVMRPPTPARNANLLVGPDAETGRLRLVAAQDGPIYPIERFHEDISVLVSRRIDDAYRTARAAVPIADQRAAQKFLMGIGSALAGDRRGKRGEIDVLEVRTFYWQHRFRLDRAIALLRASGARGGWWPGSARERMRLMFRACGLRLEDFEDAKFDEDGRPLSWIPSRERGRSIRELTGRKFRITEAQVANLLAPTGLRLSAK